MTIGIIRLGQGWRLDEDHHFDMPPQIPTQFDFRGGSPAQPNTKGQTMDYIPRTRSERYLQWKNLCDNIEAEGAKMEAADTAENAAKGAKASEAETTRQNTQAMRLAICNIKPRTLYANSGVEGTLPLQGSNSGFDPATFKPALKLSIVDGQVRVNFTKGECDSVAVYCRERGTLG